MSSLTPLAGLQAFVPQHAAAATMAVQREQPHAIEDRPQEDYGPCLAIVPVSPANEVGHHFTSFSGAVEEAANPTESELAQIAIVPVEDGQLAAPDDEEGETRSPQACLAMLSCIADIIKRQLLPKLCVPFA